MNTINLLINTAGRGKAPLEFIVRNALAADGFTSSAGAHDVHGYQVLIDHRLQGTTATTCDLSDQKEETSDVTMAKNAGMQGCNYAMYFLPEASFGVADAAKMGGKIANDYLAGKEGRWHQAWRYIAELWERLEHEGWAPKAPSVEFSVLVKERTIDRCMEHSKTTVAYMARYILADGKVFCATEDLRSRVIMDPLTLR